MHIQYDLIAIGGGSGGIATAIKAARLGARCAVIESNLWGGTCVNVGCVPKKIMWLGGYMAKQLENAPGYGFTVPPIQFDWQTLVTRRQQYIDKMHSVYQNKMQRFEVQMIKGHAKFIGADEIAVNGDILRAKHIVIATGSRSKPCEIRGAEHTIDSDGFFALKKRPHRIAIVGGGYIGVELAGICQALGCDTSLVFRGDTFLRKFDHTSVGKLMELYQQQGVTLLPTHLPLAIEKSDGKLTLLCDGQPDIGDLDVVLWATGRIPNINGLQLEEAGLNLNNGIIEVDELQNTQVPGIYAIGDVIGKAELTPVAIAQGRRLASRLFGDGSKTINYAHIPTVVFSTPPLATIGLSEKEAREKYDHDIKIYQAQFTPMNQTLNPDPEFFYLKLITVESTGKIVGCHLVGDHADEILQGFAVAIHMGATKADLDDTIAIHPTIAEELVTLI